MTGGSGCGRGPFPAKTRQHVAHRVILVEGPTETHSLLKVSQSMNPSSTKIGFAAGHRTRREITAALTLGAGAVKDRAAILGILVIEVVIFSK